MDVFIFKPEYTLKVLPVLLAFLPVTLFITALSAIIGLVCGAFLVKSKLSRRKCLRVFAEGYTTVMRCTPGIVLLFIVYYGLPLILRVVFGVNVNALPNIVFAVFALSLLFAATSSELMRSAYEAVNKGQREAAISIGLTEWQAFYRIVMPQCVKIILPSLILSLVTLIKEASLAFTIGVIDIMGKANLIIGNNYHSLGFETYCAVALIYWAVTFLIRGISQKFISKSAQVSIPGRK